MVKGGKMNIGIDIDGVLIDLEKIMVNYGTKFCLEEGLEINIQQIDYSEMKTFGWSQEQSDKFWNRYLVPYVVESSSRMFAQEIIEKFQQDGNNIYIITARDESGMPQKYYGKMQQLTKEWLKNQNIKYDKLIFASDKEKLQQCIENNIDVMIEDSPSNIQYISNQIKVIKFDCQYNKKVSGPNIITAYSWYHIYDIINKLKNN